MAEDPFSDMSPIPTINRNDPLDYNQSMVVRVSWLSCSSRSPPLWCSLVAVRRRTLKAFSMAFTYSQTHAQAKPKGRQVSATRMDGWMDRVVWVRVVRAQKRNDAFFLDPESSHMYTL